MADCWNRHQVRDVVVIGAGVIGVSVALAAQALGMSVTIVDRKGPAAEASAANGGALAFSDIVPLASPGVMRKAPKWLMDPLGPLSIPPRYALAIAPWLIRFWRASRPDRVAAGTVAQSALMALSRSTLVPFMKDTGTRGMLRQDGQLQVYESEAEFRAYLPSWQARTRHGVPFEHLKGVDAIAEKQPNLAPCFRTATFTPDWYRITDPKDYVANLAVEFMARGGQIEIAEVAKLAPSEETISIHLLDGCVLHASRAVLAAGAWSRQLANGLGDRIPLETERGYNTTLPADSLDLKCQITFGAHGFIISRVTSGIRIGGAVELGGLRQPPNYRRADAMVEKARRFVPGLTNANGKKWMGFRPSLPDSLPVIGRSKASPRVIYAFGHGHLGLTQSTGTADLVASLLRDAEPAIDLTPFRPDRF